jgi:hypothetical protein
VLALILLSGWPAIPAGIGLVIIVALLVVWWRQQTFRWPVVLALCLILAPALSYWSGEVFRVEPYRAGCDALCAGHGGAPVAMLRIEGEGEQRLPVGFALNSLVYLALALAWSAVVRTVLVRAGELRRNSLLAQLALGLVLAVAPLALSPLFLPPPQAQPRGDPQRIAINAQREIYMYDDQSQAPVMRGRAGRRAPAVRRARGNARLLPHLHLLLPARGLPVPGYDPRGRAQQRRGRLASRCLLLALINAALCAMRFL